MKSIYISIKPIYLRKIESHEKNYEFRNYIPKKEFDTLFVYESYPTCELKYIIQIENIIEFPNKIDELGIGNYEFNNGNMSKYAYQIKSVYMLERPIKLKELKEKYNFNPPQSYAYNDTYKELSEYIISKCKMNRII